MISGDLTTLTPLTPDLSSLETEASHELFATNECEELDVKVDASGDDDDYHHGILNGSKSTHAKDADDQADFKADTHTFLFTSY